jgi:phosphoribosyl 1,2-cyclic phosphate phosphodiesterase
MSQNSLTNQDTLTITILGCGSSGGVPRVGSGWGACDPQNPKNRRRRCSVLVECTSGAHGAKTSVLIDTSPDLREQLIGAHVTHLDAVLYTHEHADHTHGIDDLRPLVMHMRHKIPLYMDVVTSNMMQSRFFYCFETPKGSDYPPIADVHLLHKNQPVEITGAGGTLRFIPFEVTHGSIQALGFRIEHGAAKAVYLPDVSRIPEESWAQLTGLDLFILDALRYRPHPTHFTVEEALSTLDKTASKRAVLTNLHTDLDYETLHKQLPAHIIPAYDGLVLHV